MTSRIEENMIFNLKRQNRINNNNNKECISRQPRWAGQRPSLVRVGKGGLPENSAQL